MLWATWDARVGGVNALRGHSNFSGRNRHGRNLRLLPGYLNMGPIRRCRPGKLTEAHPPHGIEAGSLGLVQTTGRTTPEVYGLAPKSLLWRGCDKENDSLSNYLPKITQLFLGKHRNDMYEGKIKGIFALA